MKIKYDNGQICEHKGCLSHISHPCEECGRIGGEGIVYELSTEEKRIIDLFSEVGETQIMTADEIKDVLSRIK